MIRLVKAAIMPTLGTSAALAVTRANATATRVNSKGLIELCVANSPRFDYSPSTLACRGLLIEEQRVNLVLQSQNFSASWTANSSPTLTSAAAAQGVLSLDLIGDTSTANASSYSQTVTFTGNATKAISIFVKKSTAVSAAVRLRDTTAGADRLLATMTFNLSGVPTVTAWTGTLLATEDYGNGVYRLKFQTSSVTAANTNSLQVYPCTDSSLTANMTGDVYMGGAQAENALWPSSYIPTTTATVTRNADDISDTSISAWFNTIEGTLVATAVLDTIGVAGVADQPTVAAFSDNTANEDIRLQIDRSSGNRTFVVIDGGVTQAGPTAAGAATNNNATTIAGAYAANNFGMAADGGGIQTDSAGTLPTVTRLRFGSDANGVSFLNGWLRGLSYYRARLLNSDVVTVSGGGSITSMAPAIIWDFSGNALAGATGDLVKPRIAYQTWTRNLSATSVAVSTESATAPRDAPLGPETWNFWTPTAAPATWRVDFGAQKAFDYVLLLGTFGTSGAKVQLEHSDDDSTWRWIVGGVAPTDNAVILVAFPTQRARYLRLTIDALASMQVFMAGQVLTMERPLQAPHGPMPLNRETELVTSRSRSGQMLGRSIRRRGFRGSASFKNITPSWYRTYFDPFVQEARTYPFGFAWNLQDGADDVVYAEAVDDILPRYMAEAPLLEMSFNLDGYDA